MLRTWVTVVSYNGSKPVPTKGVGLGELPGVIFVKGQGKIALDYDGDSNIISDKVNKGRIQELY